MLDEELDTMIAVLEERFEIADARCVLFHRVVALEDSHSRHASANQALPSDRHRGN